MVKVTDQIGVELKFEKTPQRIVSLVPSQTELLFDLGLEKNVVGITKFCIHPKHWKKEKVIIGGTKQFHHSKILELKPDLIIANKEENSKQDIEFLSGKFKVYTSNIITIADAFKMMQDIGQICSKTAETEKLISVINSTFMELPQFENKRVAYLIWNNPIMLAGPNTFINSMLTALGLKNVIEANNSRYPEQSIKSLHSLKPDLIFLSSEPFPFMEKHKLEFEKQFGCEVILVDGEMFSWYGSRMQLFSDYARLLIL